MPENLGIRKIVVFEETINQLHGVEVDPPLRRCIAGAVLKNPLAGQRGVTDLTELVDLSVKLGELLTQQALVRLGDAASLRAYGKAVIVGTDGELEHGASMIHPRLGMAMRATLRRGTVLIPGNAKVGGPGTPIDVLVGPLDEAWDLDAMDGTTIQIADAPYADEIVLMVACATGPRPHARSKGPEQHEVDALIASFA